MVDLWAEIVLLGALIVLSGFFSGLEVALVGTSKSKVMQMLNKKVKGCNWHLGQICIPQQTALVYPGGISANTSSCGKALMELYEWGWRGCKNTRCLVQ